MNDRGDIGLIHPGQMGASIGQSLHALGWRVWWASEQRSPASRARAERAGLSDAGSLAAMAERVSTLFSICPPAAAEGVAAAVASTGFSGVFVDANAIAPATAVRIAARVRQAGAEFVDGDLIGAPARPASGSATRLYLSGPGAARVAALFDGSDAVDARCLDGPETAASALKMCYAAWTKTTAALLLGIRAGARALGVEEALLAEWAQSQPELDGRTHRALQAVPKAWRYAGEMEQMARAWNDAGVPGGFHQAAAELYGRLAGFRDTETDLATTIDALLGKIGDGETGKSESGGGETGKDATGGGETGKGETGDGETGKGGVRAGPAS